MSCLIFRNVIVKNLSKYKGQAEDLYSQITENLIFNEKRHLVTVFKDFLLLNESCDFITKYNSIYDSIRILAVLCQENNNKKLIPTFIDFYWYKIILKGYKKESALHKIIQDDAKINYENKIKKCNENKISHKKNATKSKMLKKILNTSLVKDNNSVAENTESEATIQLDMNKDNFIRGCKDFSDNNDILLLKHLLLPKKNDTKTQRITQYSKKPFRKKTFSNINTKESNHKIEDPKKKIRIETYTTVQQKLKNQSKHKSAIYYKEIKKPLDRKNSNSSPFQKNFNNFQKKTNNKNISINNFSSSLSKNNKRLRQNISRTNTNSNFNTTTATVQKSNSNNKISNKPKEFRKNNLYKITKNISYTPLQYHNIQNNMKKNQTQVSLNLKNKLAISTSNFNHNDFKQLKPSFTSNSAKSSNYKEFKLFKNSNCSNKLNYNKQKLFDNSKLNKQNNNFITSRRGLMMNSNKTFYPSTYRPFDKILKTQ